MKTNRRLLLGPGFLLVTGGILFYRLYFHIDRPAHLWGFAVSISLATLIWHLTYRELLAEMRSFEIKEGELQQSLAAEKKNAALEKAALQMELFHYQSEVVVSQEREDKIEKERTESKGQATSFHMALEEALDELRSLRHQLYIQSLGSQDLPHDLVHQHKQLQEQFREKKRELDVAKRCLFAKEGEVLVLEKREVEESLSPLSPWLDLITALYQENEALEMEVVRLEDIVTGTLSKPVRAKKEKKETDRQLLFEF